MYSQFPQTATIIDVDLEMPCTTDNSPHKANFNGQTQHYRPKSTYRAV
jgi:hypothetical protein